MMYCLWDKKNSIYVVCANLSFHFQMTIGCCGLNYPIHSLELTKANITARPKRIPPSVSVGALNLLILYENLYLRNIDGTTVVNFDKKKCLIGFLGGSSRNRNQ